MRLAFSDQRLLSRPICWPSRRWAWLAGCAMIGALMMIAELGLWVALVIDAALLIGAVIIWRRKKRGRDE
jgi:hypothetical protein